MGLTTDRNCECLKEIGPDGMQSCYLVLSEEERAKGFIRPVRHSYRHVGERPQYPLRDLTEEEHKNYDEYGWVKYEEYPKGSHGLGRYWTDVQLHSGCNQVTTMGQALAETYARQPSFYGQTFCCTCRDHLAVSEFVWEGTDERLGS